MVKIQLYPIDFDYDKEGNVRIYGKTLDNQRICVIDNSIKPYFWVIPEKGDIHEIEKIIDSMAIKEGDIVYKVIKTEIRDKCFYDEEVQAIKVTVSHPRDIKVFRREIKDMKRLETDFKFIKRYLTDKEITPLVLTEIEAEKVVKEGVSEICVKGEATQQDSDFLNNPKILALDIEVDSNFMKNQDMEKNAIYSIAFFSEGFKKVITWKRFEAEKYVEIVESEQDLIKRVKEVIDDFKPDYITGYFSDGFDLLYLKKRAEFYNMKFNIGIGGSKVVCRTRNDVSTVKIKGIPHLDIFKFIKNIMSQS